MKIHEYQAKQILKTYGVPVPRGEVVFTADDARAAATKLGTAVGGVEIEKVAHETPEKIHKAFVDPAIGLQAYQARQLAFSLGLKGDQVGKAVKTMMALYKAFVATDSSLLEINPLIVTGAGDMLA